MLYGSETLDDRNCLVLWVIRGTARNASPGALGFAVPRTQPGADVTIFYDRIERLEERALTADATAPQILGHAMAHEIGHLLLGSTKHSAAGIMKGHWEQADFERVAKPERTSSPHRAGSQSHFKGVAQIHDGAEQSYAREHFEASGFDTGRRRGIAYPRRGTALRV
jgi:hypothetical protein